jgi:hypothetical protein
VNEKRRNVQRKRREKKRKEEKRREVDEISRIQIENGTI